MIEVPKTTINDSRTSALLKELATIMTEFGTIRFGMEVNGIYFSAVNMNYYHKHEEALKSL